MGAAGLITSQLEAVVMEPPTQPGGKRAHTAQRTLFQVLHRLHCYMRTSTKEEIGFVGPMTTRLLDQLILGPAGGALLTLPIRRLLATCYSGFFANSGAQSALVAFGNALIAQIGKKQVALLSLLAAMETLGHLTLRHSAILGSRSTEIVAALVKQLRHVDADVREAAVSAIVRITQGCGALPGMTEVAKAIAKLVLDKSDVVRARVMGAVAILATKSNNFAAVSLDALFPTAVKGLQDRSAEVHLAAARAVANMLAIAVATPAALASEKAPKAKKTQRKSFAGIAIGSSKAQPLEFNYKTAVDHLVVMFSKAADANARASISLAMIAFLQATLADITASRMGAALDAATRLLLDERKASSVEVAVLTIRHGVLQYASASTLSIAARTLLIWVRHSFVCSPSFLLFTHLCYLCFRQVSRGDTNLAGATAAMRLLGEAILLLGQSAAPLYGDVVKVCRGRAAHPDCRLQWASAWCMHALCRALPRKLAHTLVGIMDDLPQAHAELSAIAAAPRRGQRRASKSSPAVPVSKLAALRGQAMLLSACIMVVPDSEHGVPPSLLTMVVGLARSMVNRQWDSGLLPVATHACVRSGWLLIHSLMSMDKAWVKLHLPVFEPMWRSAFQGATLPTESPAALIRNAVVSAAAIHSFGTFARIHRKLLRSSKLLGKFVAPQLLRIVTLLDKDFTGSAELKESVRLLQTVVVEAAVFMPLEIVKNSFPKLINITMHNFLNPGAPTSLITGGGMLQGSSAVLELASPGGSRVVDVTRAAARAPPTDAAQQLDPSLAVYAELLPAISAGPLTPLELEHSILQSLEPFQNFAQHPQSRSDAVLSVPHERQPPAPLSVRAVDSSIATFSALFRHQSSQLRERIVRHLISALKSASTETGGGRGSKAKEAGGVGAGGSCLQHREVVVRNVCAAFLGAARELGAARPQSLSSSKWFDGAREFLCAALSSPDAVVRRVVSEALGDFARAADDKWATALVERLKGAAEDKTKPATVRSGAVVALASIFRRLEPSRCAEFLQDSTIYAVARETQQPIRTWVLHAWWLTVDADALQSDRKYIKCVVSSPSSLRPLRRSSCFAGGTAPLTSRVLPARPPALPLPLSRQVHACARRSASPLRVRDRQHAGVHCRLRAPVRRAPAQHARPPAATAARGDGSGARERGRGGEGVRGSAGAACGARAALAAAAAQRRDERQARLETACVVGRAHVCDARHVRRGEDRPRSVDVRVLMVRNAGGAVAGDRPLQLRSLLCSRQRLDAFHLQSDPSSRATRGERHDAVARRCARWSPARRRSLRPRHLPLPRTRQRG